MKVFIYKLFFITPFLISTKSFGFTLVTTNPNQMGWPTNEITFLVNTANCPIDVATLISDAAAVWNNVANSSVKVAYAGTTTSTTYANPTTVYCEVNFQGVTGADEDFVPGAATVTTSNNKISTGLMYLNASAGDGNIGNFNYESLKIIIAHEIGHILGLGHSADINALMYYDASAKTSLRLGQDDIDGMSYLYPSDEFSDSKFAGCGSIKNINPPPPPNTKNLIYLVMIMLIPLVLIKKFRKQNST